jgi:hypothetical protein
MGPFSITRSDATAGFDANVVEASRAWQFQPRGIYSRGVSPIQQSAQISQHKKNHQ